MKWTLQFDSQGNHDFFVGEYPDNLLQITICVVSHPAVHAEVQE